MIFSQRQIDLEDFDGRNLQYYHYTNDDEWKINVFFAISDENTFLNEWKGFADTITFIYQNYKYMSENIEFEKWNFYIIYLSINKISKELKNKIENDKFSSRKIVEDNFLESFNDVIANNLITKHITNTDLKDVLIQTQDKIQEDYRPINEDLWKLVQNNTLLSGAVDLQKQIVEKIIRLKNEN